MFVGDHHWCKEGRVQDGRDFMDNVGRSTSAAEKLPVPLPDGEAENPALLTTHDGLARP